MIDVRARGGVVRRLVVFRCHSRITGLTVLSFRNRQGGFLITTPRVRSMMHHANARILPTFGRSYDVQCLPVCLSVCLSVSLSLSLSLSLSGASEDARRLLTTLNLAFCRRCLWNLCNLSYGSMPCGIDRDLSGVQRSRKSGVLCYVRCQSVEIESIWSPRWCSRTPIARQSGSSDAWGRSA